jgi:hypothetical protein
MLKSQTFGVGMYVAQVPEWHRFIENAAFAELNAEAMLPYTPSYRRPCSRTRFKSRTGRSPDTAKLRRAAFIDTRFGQNVKKGIFRYNPEHGKSY